MSEPTIIEKLLPCPFCGNDEVSMSFSATLKSPEPAARFVECEKCSASGPNYDIGSNDNDMHAKAFAAAAWNTRSDAEKIKALVEALRPFASHVGKSGEQVILTIGKDTWTDTLTTADFERATTALRNNIGRR